MNRMTLRAPRKGRLFFSEELRVKSETMGTVLIVSFVVYCSHIEETDGR